MLNRLPLKALLALLVWVAFSSPAHSISPRRDFNGDGRDDLMCVNVDTKRKWVDLADSAGRFGGTDWTGSDGWCLGSGEYLTIGGDFNGDGRDDLFCWRSGDGHVWLDYAGSVGQFQGTNWHRVTGWCTGTEEFLHIGDFNGDGLDDMLCHKRSTGRMWIDYAAPGGGFSGTDETFTPITQFCPFNEGAYSDSIRVGDFNGDGRDDLLCQPYGVPELRIDYAPLGGSLVQTDWMGFNECIGSETFVYFEIGDFNGDGRDDLLCYGDSSGDLRINYANAAGHLDGVGWMRSTDLWCRVDILGITRLIVGDFNGDGRDDLLCNNRIGGRGFMSIDYANPNGQFNGEDWVRESDWCTGNLQRLY